MDPPVLNMTEFMTFSLILIRVSMILILAPVFGSEIVPAQVKIVLAVALSFVLMSVVKVDPSFFPESAVSLVYLILKELMIAMVLALLIRLVLEAVQFAAMYIGYQMGFAIVNVMDPQSGSQVSVLSQFAYILALLIFLSVNGHHIIIKALVQSFATAPPGGMIMAPLVLQEVIAAFGQMFVVAIKIGAPTLGILFCSKVAMGIVAKTVPQMNVLFVGMPMDIFIGLLVFGLSLSFFVPIIGGAISGADSAIQTLLKLM